MKRICTICARGKSKGVKNKNLKRLKGIPLIVYTILQAKESCLFEFVAVSSDSEDILRIAQEYGVDFCIKRPDDLATDTAAKLPVIRHCVESVEKIVDYRFDVCVDLDCTSPLRTVEDIKNSVDLLEIENKSNVITAMPSRRSPYFNLVEIDLNGKVVLSKNLSSQVVRRQDAPKSFDMNASIYVWERECLQSQNQLFLDRTGLYVMPEERSIDIDSELDFRFVEFLMGELDESK
jgi:CMP-N-acetylneuraminic acid synthetase